MATVSKPMSFLSSGFIKLKLKGITNKAERKRACETYLVRMKAQREAQKKSRTSIEDTDDIINYLKAEIAYLSK
ncbi:MAG: hypothetical protein JNL52_08080 [Flavobacteriales bacterium]|jgi:hypothetical protein|nr:hypothetical protein [Flavobacteriales bacterium]